MGKHIFEEGPLRGHAAGDTSVEQQASQLVSDIKYKVRKKMKGTAGSNLSPAQVQGEYRKLFNASGASGAVKAIAKKKLFGEQIDYGIVPVAEHLELSRSDVFSRIFEGADGDRKFVVKVVDKATGNTSYRRADRAKIAELRANKNIASVEITGRKEPDDAYKGDPKPNYDGKKAKKDYDGDGKIESGTAEYMGSRDKAIKKAMAKEEVIYEKEEGGSKKLDVMKGKNKVNINPTIGESIRTELDALKAQKVEEAMAAAKAAGPTPEEKKQLQAKDMMLKKKIMMQKQAMQMQKQGRLPLNYSEEANCAHNNEGEECAVHGKSECPTESKKVEGEKDGTFDALRTMKPDAEKDDPRSMPTKINLAKNKLRAMGLKMSYDMEGEMTEGMSIDKQMKISQDYNRMSPEEKLAANKKAMGVVKKVAPKKDTRTDAQKMTDAVGKPRMGSSD